MAERDLAVQVATFYYRIASQARLVEVSERTRKRALELLEASKAKLQAGRVSQLDVFRAEQLAAETEGQLLDSRAALEDAKDLLRDVIEMDHGYDFRVETEIPLPAETMEVEEAAAVGVANSLEVQIARDGVVQSERTVAYTKNQLLPSFDVGVAALRGKTSENLPDTFGTDDYEVATFIAASAPVDRTAEVIAFNNALIERDRRRREVARVERRTASDARRAARSLERLGRSYELSRSKAEFAESEVEVATLRYQRGLANNLDVVNAELGLLGAQSHLFATLAELAVARLQLRATLGILNPREDL
jgi:outer membrane protein TolC